MARLLIVEDNPELADNIAEILGDVGHGVHVVDNVQAALDLLAGEAFDGILTDFRLPGQSGLDLIAQLRARADATPVVLMTAFADEAAAETARTLGALAVVFKPLDLPRLFTLINEFVHTRRRVLVLEDNDSLARNLEDVLRESGFDPLVLGSVREVMDQEHLPDVAVIDYRLPDGDGLEAARLLAARDPGLPIILMSGYTDEASERIDAGNQVVRKMIAKPVRMASLLEEIQSHCRSRGAD